MTPVVLVPAVDACALYQCVASMAADVAAQVLIVDGTVAGLNPRRAVWRGAEVHRPAPHTHERDYRPRRNIGVSRAMNLAARRCLAGEFDAVVWVSTSMRFGPDGGRRLVDAAASSEFGAVGLPGQLHSFGLTRRAFEAAGLWDETTLAYYEDTDFRYRLHLAAGTPAHGRPGKGLDEVDVGGHVVRDGAALDVLRRLNPGRRVVNLDALKAWYEAKWGGPPGEETYVTPFGDPAKGIDWWEPVTREELIDRYGLGL